MHRRLSIAAKVETPEGVSVVPLRQVSGVVGIPEMEELLSGFLGYERIDAVCPNCGWSLAQVQERAVLGCPLCYEVFKSEITSQQIF